MVRSSSSLDFHSMAPLFHYSERPPASALRPWLWNYWEFRVESDEPGPVPHHVPPDGSTSIAAAYGGGKLVQLIASGPRLDPFVVPATPGSHYWGVRCRPESGCLVLGTRSETLTNRSQPLTLLAPALAAGISEALVTAGNFSDAVTAMDRIFTDHLAGVEAPDPLVREAVDRLVAQGADLSIGALAVELQASERTLRRRFRIATGLTPKQFARIYRFRSAAMTLLEEQHPGWSRVASGTGFADQAHMIHEFKQLTGLTPEKLGDRVRTTRHGDLVV